MRGSSSRGNRVRVPEILAAFFQGEQTGTL
jgi:hypothetical protein